MSFSNDSSPTSSLPGSPESATPLSSLSETSEYRAPLSGEAPEPSIDGTSVGGGEGGIRAGSAEEISEDDKKVSLMRVVARALPFEGLR